MGGRLRGAIAATAYIPVEIWFGLLTRKALRGASFASNDQLRDAIQAFVVLTKEHPKPFRWRKREVKRCQLRNSVVNLRN